MLTHFGLYHGFTIESLTGPAAWGLIYGVLAYWTKGLAIPIGFHAWVILIQAIFSQKEKWVSGVWPIEVTSEATLLSIEQVSLAALAFLFLAGLVLGEVYISGAARTGQLKAEFRSFSRIVIMDRDFVLDGNQDTISTCGSN